MAKRNRYEGLSKDELELVRIAKQDEREELIKEINDLILCNDRDLRISIKKTIINLIKKRSEGNGNNV